MLESVSSISCNNDAELGKIIAEAYTKVGKDGCGINGRVTN